MSPSVLAVAPPPVDVHNTIALCEYILRKLNDAGVPLKSREKRGTFGDDERLAAWQLGTTRDRDEAMQLALNYIRFGNKERNGRDGYAATWAAPGSGKTHLLDAIVGKLAITTGA